MSEFFLNPENLKIFFVAASALYSLNFWNSRRNIKHKRIMNKMKMERSIKDQLQKVDLSKCSSEQVYEIFKNCTEKNYEEDKNQERTTKEGNQNVEQNKKQNDPESSIDQEKRQMQEEIQEIMANHLLTKLKSMKSVSELKRIHQSQFKTNMQNKQQKNEDDQQDQGTQMQRIKPCRENVIKMQHAIMDAKITTKSEEQHIFPVKQTTQMDEQKQIKIEGIQRNIKVRKQFLSQDFLNVKKRIKSKAQRQKTKLIKKSKQNRRNLKNKNKQMDIEPQAQKSNQAMKQQVPLNCPDQKTSQTFEQLGITKQMLNKGLIKVKKTEIYYQFDKTECAK